MPTATKRIYYKKNQPYALASSTGIMPFDIDGHFSNWIKASGSNKKYSKRIKVTIKNAIGNFHISKIYFCTNSKDFEIHVEKVSSAANKKHTRSYTASESQGFDLTAKANNVDGDKRQVKVIIYNNSPSQKDKFFTICGTLTNSRLKFPRVTTMKLEDPGTDPDTESGNILVGKD